MRARASSRTPSRRGEHSLLDGQGQGRVDSDDQFAACPGGEYPGVQVADARDVDVGAAFEFDALKTLSGEILE